jgi:hypothetical protein
MIENGTQNPALNVNVAYSIRTRGELSTEGLGWKLRPDQAGGPTNSTDEYVKAIDKLQPRANIPILAPLRKEPVANVPSQAVFVFTSLTSGGPLEAPTSRTLRPADLIGYVRYDDNANNRRRLRFCLPLDGKENPNCAAVNVLDPL